MMPLSARAFAFERFEREVLAPLGFTGLPRFEFPVHTRFAA